MAEAYLTTQQLSKSFGETRALVEVSVDIEPGKVHTILGENGSGKSTLVKTLAGIIVPDTGGMAIEGARVSPKTPGDMIARGVSIVLQEVLVAPNRSVLDNVMLGRDGVFTFNGSRADKAAQVTAQLAKLTRRRFDLEAMVGDLPLHEQQILVICRGFAAAPRVLIMDEVTAALDLADREMLFDAIRAFCVAGGAVVFVSHRMPEIMALSDVVYVMQNGRNTARLMGDDINPDTLLKHLTQESACA